MLYTATVSGDVNKVQHVTKKRSDEQLRKIAEVDDSNSNKVTCVLVLEELIYNSLLCAILKRLVSP